MDNHIRLRQIRFFRRERRQLANRGRRQNLGLIIVALPFLSILGKNHQRSDVIYVYTARPLSINNGNDCRVFSKGEIESTVVPADRGYHGNWVSRHAGY